jgi:AraC family transcriptional regulator
MRGFGSGGPGSQTAGASAQSAYPIHALYDGWLNVERSTLDAMDRYVTEHMLSFPGGWVEARQLSWSRPLESVCTTSHRCYMLNLSLSGRTAGGAARNLRSMRNDGETIGRMWLVPPDQTLRFSSVEGQGRSIRCMLDADLFESFLEDAPRWQDDDASFRAAFNISSGQIEWLLRRMYRELRSPDFATLQVIETLAKQLTVEIIRALKLRRGDAGFNVGGLAPWRLRLIDQRLRSEEALPGLDDLANLCDMTVRHLSRSFRSETGRTLGKHIEAAMVDRASRMLRGGAPVRKVATELGYASPGSFATAFRRATGLLPSELNTTERKGGLGKASPSRLAGPQS